MRSYVRVALGMLALGIVLSGLTAASANTATGNQVQPQQTVAAPHGVTTLLPQIVQQGVAVRSAGGAQLAGYAKFYPARYGRPVVIQRRVDAGSWEDVTVKRENSVGRVDFIGAAKNDGGLWFTYRAVAQKYSGEPRIVASSMRGDSWQQQFSDEFGGTSLDRSKWDYRMLGVYSEASRRARSASAKSAVAVSDDRLLLKVQKAREPGYFKNGHIGTMNTFSFRYGVAAARVKFLRHRGQHGSFWLQPYGAPRVAGSPELSGAEIDVAEYFGDGFRRMGGLQQSVYFLNSDGEMTKLGGMMLKATRSLEGTDDWWKSYHVFSVQWTATRYVFRVDGVETWRTRRGVSGQPEYLILSLLSSDWELPHLDRRNLPSKIQVDWVKVWQRN